MNGMFNLLDRKTTASRRFWTKREAGNAAYTDGYWETRTHPLRAQIADTIAALSPASVLEIGAHCGPNLWAISQRCDARLVGTDVSPFVLDAGRRHGFEMHEAPAHRLPFADRSFDVVLASGVLLCVGPREIDAALRELTRIAARYVVIAEPRAESDTLDRYPNTTYWLRPYGARLLPLGFTTLTHEDVAEPLGHINSLLVAERH